MDYPLRSVVVGCTLMLWRAKDPKVAGLESIKIQINFKNTAKQW